VSAPTERTRQLVALIIGVLGVVLLVDTMVIVLVHEHVDLSGARAVFVILVGALLVIGGVVTFAWPQKGSVETTDEPHGSGPPGGG